MNGKKSEVVKDKAHGFKDMKYINEQNYQAWLEDLHPAQKHLAERVGTSWTIQGCTLVQGKAHQKKGVVVGFCFLIQRCHLLTSLYRQGFLAQNGTLIDLPRKDTYPNSQKGWIDKQNVVYTYNRIQL